MDFKFISVVIPAHNEQIYIEQCLESLIFQDYPKDQYEIIVVDNNSKDNTQEIARKFDVQIIEQESGPVGAVRNAGAKEAKGELLAFIDADCVAPNNWLSKGAQLLLNEFSAYGGGYDLRPEPFWLEKAWLLETKEPPKDFLGGCIFIRKKDFRLAGSFDENITSGEDTKLSNSLRNLKYNVVMTNELNVIHLGNPITLKKFFLRQIWHSENYLQNWDETAGDPTFYLLSLFMAGVISFILSIINQSITGIIASTVITFATPFILTLKRLRRSKNFRQNLRNLPTIYFLDITYLSGRIFGLCKSTLRILRLIT